MGVLVSTSLFKSITNVAPTSNIIQEEVSSLTWLGCT